MAKRLTLKALRAQRDMSQTALARKAGVSLQTVSRIECGRPMEWATAERIASALDVAVPDLFPEFDTRVAS